MSRFRATSITDAFALSFPLFLQKKLYILKYKCDENTIASALNHAINGSFSNISLLLFSNIMYAYIYLYINFNLY